MNLSAHPILERNLLVLSGRHPELARRMSRLEPRAEIGFIPARSGLPVPVRRKAQNPLPLHSTFDPVKEGQRLSAMYPGDGVYVFLGFGGGYHILPFLKRQGVSRALVLERDPALFRAVIDRLDLHSILMDQRITLMVDADLEQVRQKLLDTYFPALEGDLQTVTLRSLFESDRDYYQGVVDTIRGLISRFADDYTVQARFGRKWFTNTLLNLPRAQDASLRVKPIRRALITGAGPSLEDQLDSVRRMRREATLIATDTSLPVLLSAGLQPDLIISIDCQQVSYHHFLQGLPPEVPLLLDLASPPVLGRLSDRVLFFSSGHPFAQYLGRHWRRFPSIDTSGGNVSHAAVSLAHCLGAEEIELFGVDFSCPEGKSYSRGTFLYPFFHSRENRNQPLEHLFFSFLMRGPELRREHLGGALSYTSRQMDAYRSRMEELLRRLPLRAHAHPGKGFPLDVPVRPRMTLRRTVDPLFSAGAPVSDWRSFLGTYLERIDRLPVPAEPVGAYLAGVKESEKTLWMTLMPAAAALREDRKPRAQEAPLRSPGGAQLLEDVRQWSRGLIFRVLSR